MSKFEVWMVQADGKVRRVELWQEREALRADIERHFALMRQAGEQETAPDKVLALLVQTVVVADNKFGLVQRALRHFSAIGLCDDLVDLIEQAWDEDVALLGWGDWTEETVVQAQPHDFGTLQI